MDSSVKEIRENLKTKAQFSKWAKGRCKLDRENIGLLYTELKDVQKQIKEQEFIIKAKSRTLKRIMSIVDEGRLRAKMAKRGHQIPRRSSMPRQLLGHYRHCCPHFQ